MAIYDVRNPRDTEPMVKSSFATGKHADPVWKVQWVDHTAEHGEALVSISTDGRVSQWSIKKVMLILKPSYPAFSAMNAEGHCLSYSIARCKI